MKILLIKLSQSQIPLNLPYPLFFKEGYPNEHQIDQMVYKLYGLTEDEIKIVEM
jgi:hypothetical protein